MFVCVCVPTADGVYALVEQSIPPCVDFAVSRCCSPIVPFVLCCFVAPSSLLSLPFLSLSGTVVALLVFVRFGQFREAFVIIIDRFERLTATAWLQGRVLLRDTRFGGLYLAARWS